MKKILNKKRMAQVTCLTLAAALMSPIALAEVSGEISATNDYRFRGVSQSAGEVALQAGIDWSAESGFYVGAWASNVDFDDKGTPLEERNGASVELDIYAGYAGSLSEEVEYDVTLYYYTYPGDDVEQNYLDLNLGLYYQDFHVAYWYTNDYGDLDYHYTELNYSTAIAEDWSLDLHAGYSFGDGPEDDMGEYVDYSIGVSTSLAGADVSLAWLDTDISGETAIDSDTFQNQGTLLLSASYAF